MLVEALDLIIIVVCTYFAYDRYEKNRQDVLFYIAILIAIIVAIRFLIHILF